MRNRTGIVFDERFLDHDEPGHPENARRLRAVIAALEQSGILDELTRIEGRAASDSEIKAVHRPALMEQLQILSYEGGGYIDGDTYVSSDSWAAASLASGAVLCATEAVMAGDVANSFALVRPPGHHATPARAMGFCLLNHVAIAVRHALRSLGCQRVAIIDWDTHHGNGTQDAFYDDGAVLYCSSHTWPLFPGTGAWREMGDGDGHGTTLNVPLPYYTGDDDFHRVYDEVILPAVVRFKPDLIVVSAGFDCHWADPLAPMNVSVTGYAALAQKVYDTAAEVCEGRLVCALEGGYDLRALAACVLATLRVLQGHPDLVEDPLGIQRAPATDVGAVIAQLQRTHPLLVGL